jgi:TRAP-type mannitol/chloroaromatic compound transport system permease small subunit
MSDQPPSDRRIGARQLLSWQHLLSFEAVLSILNSIGTLWIFTLMVVICLDVVGRTVFNSPLPGVLELVRLSIVGIVFIQLGHTLRAGRITRADNLIHIVQRRLPRFGYGMQALFELAGTGVFVVLFQASLPLFLRSWASGEYAGIEGYITYPIWPVRLIILIGSFCAGLQFLFFAWRDTVAAWRGQAPEVARAEIAESVIYRAEN